MPFQLYDLISFPLATPQTEDFYSILATEIKSFAFSPDADLIVQIYDGHVYRPTVADVRVSDRNGKSGGLENILSLHYTQNSVS